MGNDDRSIRGNVSDFISMSLNENEVSVSSTKQIYINRDLELPEKNNLEPINELRQIRQKSSNRLIFAQLNINAIKNKFDSLVELIKENVDILLISETKIDSSFPTAQFLINGFTTYRRDRNRNGGGMLLYIGKDIPSNLLHTDDIVEGFYLEISIRKKKWLLGCSCNPHKRYISPHLIELGKNLDFNSKYGNFILLGDLNAEPTQMKP